MLDRGETVSVTLTGATTTGAVTAATTPAVTEIVDAGTETVSVTSNGAVTEGSSATFTVALSGAVSSPVTLGWSTSDGTATAGSDYTAVSSGTVTFTAGSTASQTLTVSTQNDTVAEAEETFTVTLTGPNLPEGVSVGTATATGRITDDEALTVSVTGPSMVAEGNTAAFTVSVTGGASTAAVVVSYTVGGTATSGTDYTAPSGPLTVGAGDSSGTIEIRTLDDGVLDRGETVSVTLTGATTTGVVTAATTPAVTEIVDAGTETVSVTSNGAVTEGSSATFTVALSGAVSSPVTLGWSTSDGTATAGSDYTAVSSGTVTFAAGSTASQTLTVSTRNDTEAEVEETFTVTLTGPNLPEGVSVGTATATGRITDDEALTVSVTGPSMVAEGNTAAFTVSVTGGASTAAVVVSYTVGGTATSGTDYTAPSGPLTVGAGDSSGTIEIRTLDDGVLDRGETVSVTLTEATTTGVVTAATTPAVTEIVDAGTETVSVTSNGAVTEGSSATFTVALSGAVSSPVTLGWSTSDGTATAGSDYTAVSSGTVTFAAGSTASQTLTVSTRNDTEAEVEETFTVTLTGPNLPEGVSVGTATATGRITDDEALTVSVTGPSTVAEGNTAAFTVSVTGGASTAAVVVSYAVGGTATSGTDYTAPSGPLTVGAGDSSGTISIAALDDGVLDPGETVSVTLTGATTTGAVTAATTPAVTEIVDAGTETVSVTSNGAVTEGSSATFTVALSGAVSSPVTLGWSTSDGTATAGSDYTAVSSGTVTFTAGSTASQTLTVSTRNDTVAEAEETFTVTLTGPNLPEGVSVGTATATGRITDDEALTVSVTGPSMVAEGNTAAFTVSVTGGASTAAVVVSYTVGGTATSGTDYTAPSGPLTVGAGDSSGTIEIRTLDDGVLDRGETVSVTLTGATTTGVVTAATTPAVTEIVDAGTETVSVTSNGAVTEGSSATFTVALSGAVSSPVTLGWSTSDGTATAGSDYTAVSSGTVTFAAGSTASQTLTVSTRNDTEAEVEETFTVTLTGPNLPEGVSVGTATATGRITDDEALTVSVTGPSMVAEGNTAAFTVSVTGGASTAAVVVSYTVGGTATSGTDYTAPSGPLTVGAGDSSGTIEIRTLDDGVLDRGETVSVTLTEATTTGVVTAATTPAVTEIVDAGTETVSVTSNGAVTEGSSATFTVALSGAVSSPVTLGWSTSDGTATAGSDYTAVSSGTVTFAAGSTASQTLTVSTQHDTVAEVEETFTVTLTGPNLPEGVSVGTATATGRITDDEALTVSVTGPSTVVEGNTAAFTVSVTGGTSTADVVVSYTVGGTATSGTDYTAPSGPLTVGAGDSSGTISIAALDDGVLDPGETVSVTLTGATTTGAVTAATTPAVTKIADEGTVTVSVTSDGAVTEGLAATFTVALSGAVSSPVTLGWSTSDGTATAGSDYTAVSSGTVTFAAGSTASQTLTVSTQNDTEAEAEETFTVTLTGPNLPDGVSVGTAMATGAITDNNTASSRVTLAATPSVVSEGAGETRVTVTATLNESGSPEVTVILLSVTGATATAADFEPVTPFELTIPERSLTGTAQFTLEPADDEVAEGAETLSVSGTTNVSGLTVSPATLTLTDDASASTEVTLSLAPQMVSEAAGATTVTVTGTLNGSVRSASTEVTVSVAGDTADSDDFEPVSDFTLTIAAEATLGTAQFTLEPADDEVAEGAETLSVSGTTNVSGLTVSPATLTLTDDASASTEVTLSLAPQMVSEAAGATTVTVTGMLNGSARSASTEVTVSVAGDTADSDDFEPVSDFTLTIPASAIQGSAQFTLTPVDDGLDEDAETLSVTGTTDVPGLSVAAAALTIIDGDAVSESITLAVEPPAVSEDAGATEVGVKATLNGPVRQTKTMVAVTVDEDEEDYAVAPARFEMEIPAGETSVDGMFMLTPVDDEEAEDDRRVDITGTNGEGLPVTATALTIVDDDESNKPPTFDRTRYTFDLRENRSGRNDPVVLGTVRARDSDSDRIRYALFAGDRDRFTVSRESGAVSYIGAGEDFETGPSHYDLQVTAKDELYSVKADVVVRVVDAPEAPEAEDDRAETPEDTPKVVDVLANDTDPDGDRLRVSSVTAPEHGTATTASGGIRYAPDLNWHGTDRFDYTVADAGGLTSTATVKVRVTPVNDPPEAVDDEAETLEDVPAVVDVLANDSDVDGDPLRVVSVGPAGHGTTAIAAGGVRYASVLNWYGTDRFTYTIADPKGLTSTATVTMTVLPVNDAPEAVGVIPDQSLQEGGEAVTVELTEYFTDVDGDVLTYEAVSSDETAVTVAVSGSTLTLAAVVTGTASVMVTASDVEGLTATQTFGVTVGDRLVRGVLTDALAALGRGHLSSARLTIGRRLETGGGGMTRMMVAGQQLSPDAWDRMGAGGLEQSHELLFRAATLQQRRSPTDLVGTSADPRLQRPGAMGPMGAGFGGPGGGRDRLLQGTDVLLSFGGADGASSPAGVGRRLTVWGQGDLQSFRGAPAETTGYDGDLRTGYLGVDAQLSARWLAGVAVARSGGTGNWQVGSSSGRLTTGLTVVHPYVRWGGRETAVWALAGIGRGTAENVRALTGRRGTSPLSLGLGLVEGRRRVATTAGGLEVDLRGEASWARLRTGDGEETIDGLQAGVRRVRTGVEVTLPLGAPGGVQVAPFGALSTRHDGGAGQTGVGLEVAGGVRASGGRIRIEAQGRMLALHTAADYEERGVSVTASVGGGQYEPGLTASLRPRWGGPGYGAESLWQDRFQPYAEGAGRDDRGVDARLGYGVGVPGGRLLTPFGGYGQMGSGRRVQVGANLGMAGLFGGDLDSPVQVEFIAERYGRPGGAADHRVTLFGIVNFGARPRTPCNRAQSPCAAAGAVGSGPSAPRLAETGRVASGPPSGGADASAATASAVRSGDAEPSTPPAVVAVGAFVNLTAVASDDWIGAGIAETLSATIEGLDAVEVIRRGRVLEDARALDGGTSSSRTGAAERRLLRASRQRGAAWLVSGAYRRVGEQVQVAARLIDTGTGAVAARVEVDGAADEIFLLQDRLGEKLAGALVLLAGS